VFYQSADATSQYIQYKYGPEAGQAAQESVPVAKDMLDGELALRDGRMLAEQLVLWHYDSRAAQALFGCQRGPHWLLCAVLKCVVLVLFVSCLCVVQPPSTSPAWVHAPSSARPPRQPARCTSSPHWQACTQMSRQQGAACP
jgi:hypothetical protein